LASVALETLTEPNSPPTDIITFWPRFWAVAMSLIKSLSVYPPSLDERVGSKLNSTFPGVPVASAKATAITS